MSELRDFLTSSGLAAQPKLIEPLPRPQLHHPSLLFEYPQGKFASTWFTVSEPFVMEPDTFRHDFDQVVCFVGGDATRIDELGGVCEFWLGDEKGSVEKFEIRKPMVFFIPKGVYHCPIKFLEVFDKEKPMIFQDITLTDVYRKWLPGSDQALDMFGVPIKD
jgi:hypothetical protein